MEQCKRYKISQDKKCLKSLHVSKVGWVKFSNAADTKSSLSSSTANAPGNHTEDENPTATGRHESKIYTAHTG